MSLKIGSILPKTVIHNLSKQVGIPMARKLAPLPLQAASTKELNYEELEFLIEELKIIAEEKCQRSMGFLPRQKSKEDVLFGMKAYELANRLLDDPRIENIKKAKRFLRANKIIEVLEVIAKERNISTFGFRPGPNSNSDVKLASKSSHLAYELKISNDRNTSSALEFIALVDLIKELEGIGEEKSRGNFGFHQKQKPQDEKNKMIEKVAFKLANALKEVPNEETIQRALEFTKLIYAYNAKEVQKEIEASEPQYAQAA